jgi:hypothetical protein
MHVSLHRQAPVHSTIEFASATQSGCERDRALLRVTASSCSLLGS